MLALIFLLGFALGFFARGVRVIAELDVVFVRIELGRDKRLLIGRQRTYRYFWADWEWAVRDVWGSRPIFSTRRDTEAPKGCAD